MTPRGVEETKWQEAQRSVNCLPERNLKKQTDNRAPDCLVVDVVAAQVLSCCGRRRRKQAQCGVRAV